MSQILGCAQKARVAHRGDKHNIKPLKDYVKSFGLHESGTGYSLSFAIDERSSLKTKDYVSRLVSCLEVHDQPFRLVMNRYYMSVDNVQMLQAKNLDVYGTLRNDRGLPQAVQDDVRAHPLEDGEFRSMMAPSDPSPLVVFMWRDSDKKGTPFLSTCHPPTEECKVRRRQCRQNAISKPCPQCASDTWDFATRATI